MWIDKISDSLSVSERYLYPSCSTRLMESSHLRQPHGTCCLWDMSTTESNRPSIYPRMATRKGDERRPDRTRSTVQFSDQPLASLRRHRLIATHFSDDSRQGRHLFVACTLSLEMYVPFCFVVRLGSDPVPVLSTLADATLVLALNSSVSTSSDRC